MSRINFHALTDRTLSCRIGPMNYIVLDLEWNQAQEAWDERNKLLTFEIIEIGAVKLNSRMEILDTYHELIKPQVYDKMHHVTEKLIQIHMEELERCRSFDQVMKDFLEWCGDGYIFGTWGTHDLTELQRNMQFFGMGALSSGPFRFYDIQKLFSLSYEDGKSRRSLECAADFLHFEKDIPFHRALSDAYYTARVLQQIKDPRALQHFSYDTFTLPTSYRDEVHVVFEDYAKYISRAFPDKEMLMTDREVISTKCYLCHRNLRKKIRWFSPNGKHYFSVSYCDKHGYMKGKIRIKKAEDDRVYAVKTTKFISAAESEAIWKKKEHAKQLRKEKRSRERST